MPCRSWLRIEDLLRQKLGRGDDFRLSDYFDFVAGTSTGAIIAACISVGMKVSEISKFYIESGEEMLDKASLLKRFRYKYADEKLANNLQDVFGKDTTLGSDKLKTVLMMVMRNATTDSPGRSPITPLPSITRSAAKMAARGMIAILIFPCGNSSAQALPHRSISRQKR